MSQNSTTPTTDENCLSTNSNTRSIHNPIFVPMIPMFLPYSNTNTGGQAYFTPNVYPNILPHPSTSNHRHGNFGINYNPFYPPVYPSTNHILPSTTHITNPSGVIPRYPLMSTTLLPISQSESSSRQLLTNENERNKNLNIRECQSPVPDQTEQQREPFKMVNTNNKILESNENFSSTIPIISHSKYQQNPFPVSTSTYIQEINTDNCQDDFLTFIKEKTKKSLIMPNLNPLATEFSFENNQIITKDSTNEIDHHQQDQDNQSFYRMKLDNLIEKSLESMEAIKKVKKTSPVHDVSIQCTPINYSINRSTQTINTINNRKNDMIEEYNQRTIKLMENLLENFRCIYQHDLYDQCKTMAQTCDELYHLLLFMNHVILLSKTNEQQLSTINFDNPFNNIIEQLANDSICINRSQTSSYMMSNAGRGTRRLINSTENLVSPSFSCRQIDPVITTKPLKLCLFCGKAIYDTDDVVHKLCRELPSCSNMFDDV